MFFVRKLSKLMSSLYDLRQTEFFNRNFVTVTYLKICNYLIKIYNFKLCRRNAATVNKFVCQPEGYEAEFMVWFTRIFRSTHVRIVVVLLYQTNVFDNI